jgi:hypothetical protein
VNWKAETKENLISVVEGEEADNINKKHRIEIGNIIYKISNSDALDFYIIAKDIKLEDKLVKYFDE